MGDDPEMIPYVKSRFDSVVRLSPGFIDKTLFALYGRTFNAPDPFRALNSSLMALAQRSAYNGYDAIISWSQLHSVHLVGLALSKNLLNLPWMAHFSDPWVDNPYSSFSKLELLTNKAMERRVVENADYLTFTAKETLYLFSQKYEILEKSEVIPHCFDPLLFPRGEQEQESKVDPDRILVRYIGSLYGKRTPLHLVKALKQLHEERPDISRKLRMEIIGPVEPAFRKLSSEYGLADDLLTFSEPVSYLASLRKMKEADALLVIDAPADLSVFLPSKLIDYIGAGKPLLGITPPGASHDLIQKMRGQTVSPEDVSGICHMLSRTVSEAGELKDPDKEQTEMAESFSLTKLADRTGEIINSLVERG